MTQTDLFDAAEREPTGRIILLDLNVTLSANAQQWRGLQARKHGSYRRRADAPDNLPTYAEWIAQRERYRQWLVELLRDEFVIIVTVRRKVYESITLQRIADQTGWVPQGACFRGTESPEGETLHRADRPAVRRRPEPVPRPRVQPAGVGRVEATRRPVHPGAQGRHQALDPHPAGAGEVTALNRDLALDAILSAITDLDVAALQARVLGRTLEGLEPNLGYELAEEAELCRELMGLAVVEALTQVVAGINLALAVELGTELGDDEGDNDG